MPEPERTESDSTGPDHCVPATLAGQLRVALTRTSRKLRAHQGSTDLSEGQLAVLSAVHHHGPMTPGALADHESVRPPSMTRTVNSLVELGLVAKVGDTADRRLVVVELTEPGTQAVVESRRHKNEWLTEQLSRLTEDDRSTLARASELLGMIAAR